MRSSYASLTQIHKELEEGLDLLRCSLAEDVYTRYLAADGAGTADRLSFHSQLELSGLESAGHYQPCEYPDAAVVYL